MLEEAATLFLNDEPLASRMILREVVTALVGFEDLAAVTNRPGKERDNRVYGALDPSSKR